MAEDQGIALQDLIWHFTELVDEIRNNSQNYLKLQGLIKQIEDVNIYTITKKLGVLSLFKLYKRIIHISIELRKILPQFEVEVSQYNSIDYALYFNNQVYYTEHLKPEWLSATKGGLMLRLSPAIKEIEEDIKNDTQIEILNMFNKHYQLFLDTVEDSYMRHHNGKSILKGDDKTFNKGHIAEAHERHLQQHHSILYQMAKNKNIEPNEMIESHIQEMQTQNNSISFHETASTIWKEHLLASFGYQRGTVAGDINSTQVKQGQSGSSLRLTKIGNLRAAIKVYSDLFNTDIPSSIVATKIALYMSDIVDKDIRNFVNRDFLQEIQKKDPDFTRIFDKLGQYLNVTVHI